MVGIAEIPIDPDADPAPEIEDGPHVGAAASLAPNLRLTFCLAGRAVFTLRNALTENRFTYRIRARRRHGYFVGVLRGPDNESAYTQIGTIEGYQRGPRFIPVYRENQGQSLRVFAWAWPRIVAGTLPPEIEFHHAGRCGRCNRLLTTPESIASGIGPKCAELANR